MAGVAEPIVADMPRAAGIFGSLARAQYAALAAMRWRLFRNNLRNPYGVAEVGARIFFAIFGGVIGLGLAFGLGAAAYALAMRGRFAYFPLLLWATLLIWQTVPVVMASLQEHIDVSGLLRFPVSFPAYYLLNLIFGLIDDSTVLGGLCCIGMGIGLTVAKPDLSAWAALALLLFAAFNILLVRAIFAWLDRWLAQRRTREIFGSLFFFVLLGTQFFNPAVRQQMHHGQASEQDLAQLRHWGDRANAVSRWLPPGLAGRVVQDAAAADRADQATSLSVLGLYVFATGGLLGVRLRAHYRGENLGQAFARDKAQRHSGKWLLDGSGPVAAVLEKELRTLLRAAPLLYALGAPLLMVFLFAGLFQNMPASKGGLPVGLLASLTYTTLGFTQMFYNTLGGEGPGIQLLLLSPTPLRTVLLAKNLFYTMLFVVDALVVFAVAAFRIGLPGPLGLACVVAWLLFSVPAHLAAGNILSLTLPYRINLGRIGRQRGAQANGLTAMLIQLGVIAVGAVVFASCISLGRLWLAVPVLLALAAGAIFVWTRVLTNVDSMAHDRRDRLLSTLVKTE